MADEVFNFGEIEQQQTETQRAQLQYPLDVISRGILKDSIKGFLPELNRVQDAALISGATTFEVRNTNVMQLTASAAVNITTITNGYDGQILTIIFGDANVTLVDDSSGVTNTLDLGGVNITGAADSTLQLVFDGTSWIINTSASLSAISGTIGGFSIGSDYIRDIANSFGLASTVTGGDDVRIWAGATFANRATAPFRVTEAGTLTASGSITLNLTQFTAGEAIEAGDAVFLASSTSIDVHFASCPDNDTNDDFGSTSEPKIAQSFNVPGTGTYILKQIFVDVSKINVPVDDAQISIQADSSGNPSGTSLGSVSFDTSSYGGETLNVSLTGGTTYWVVFERTGAASDANRYQTNTQSSGGTRLPANVTWSTGYKSYDGAAWGSVNTRVIRMSFTMATQQGLVYKTDARVAAATEGFVGIVNANTGVNAAPTITANGNFTSSGLTVGPYYIQNSSSTTSVANRGDITAASGQTVVKKAGIASTTTNLIVSSGL